MFLEEQARSAENDENVALDQAQESENAQAYVQSYYWMRVIVGALGIALPFILLIGEQFLDDATIGKRGSLSAYYHSGMRDAFTTVLAIVGILLITYKIAKRNFDFWMTAIAGIAAIGVAIFPTGIPADVDVEPTPLQTFFGEERVEVVHYTCAFLFIVLLMWLCFDFARREKDPSHRHPGGGSGSADFWYRFHRSMGWLIAVAIAFIIVMWLLERFGVDKDTFLLKHKLFIGETLAAVAFGISWLAEGWDPDVLWGRLTNKAN